MSNSNLESKFLLLWEKKYPELLLGREQRIIPNRRFCFDFAHLSSKVAIEINGGNWVRGRHTRPAQLNKEYEKINLAQSYGYVVFILDNHMINEDWIMKIGHTILQRYYVR